MFLWFSSSSLWLLLLILFCRCLFCPQTWCPSQASSAASQLFCWALDVRHLPSLLFIHPPSETSDSNIQLLHDFDSLMPQGLLTLMAQIEILIFPPVPPSLSIVTSLRSKAQAWKTCDSPLPPYPLTLPKSLSLFCPPLFHCPISASQIPT